MQCVLSEWSYLKGIAVSTPHVLIDRRLVLCFICPLRNYSFLPSPQNSPVVLSCDKSRFFPSLRRGWEGGEQDSVSKAKQEPLPSLKCTWYLYYYLYYYLIINIPLNRKTSRQALGTSPLVQTLARNIFARMVHTWSASTLNHAANVSLLTRLDEHACVS